MATREHTLYQEVISVLEDLPTSRDRDEVLMLEVYKRRGVDIYAPFYSVINSRRLPSYESISRMRRKAQEERPDLRPSVWASKKRTRRQKDLFDFLDDRKKSSKTR